MSLSPYKYLRLATCVPSVEVAAVGFNVLQTIASLEERLDPTQFIRVHRSTIVRRDRIAGLRHDGSGVWFVDLAGDGDVRIGRT